MSYFMYIFVNYIKKNMKIERIFKGIIMSKEADFKQNIFKIMSKKILISK